MKKNKTLLLSLACVTMLCSCGKSVSLEKAKEHCAANYSQTTVAEKYQSAKAKVVMDIKKSDGIFATILNLKEGKTENEIDYEVEIVTEDDLDDFGEDAKFTINGKKLTVSGDVDVKDMFEGKLDEFAENIKGTGNAKYEYNAEGLLTKTTESMDISMNISKNGVSVTGSFKCTSVTTITYTAK